MPTPLFEHPHKFIAHRHIFESLWYNHWTGLIPMKDGTHKDSCRHACSEPAWAISVSI